MAKVKIVGEALPNIPWQDKPDGCVDPVWRYTDNPIIPRDAIPCSNSIFNSAVVPFEGKFAGVFRVDHKTRQMTLHTGRSEDGIKWDIEHDAIEFECDIPEIARFVYGYDPRVCLLEGKYYVHWCNWYHAPTIGLAWTTDFKTYHQMENAFLPFQRNGVLFPRKINGSYMMLNRPSDNGHTPFGDIFLSQSPDLVHWGRHRYVMGTAGGWQSTKVGAGPTPIETSEGWLMVYHGVLTSCNGFVYSTGAALLDLDEPWKVIARTAPYIMSPQTYYECVGDVPNVAFPCAALCCAKTGRIAFYYGGADTVVALAFARMDELVGFIKDNSMV
jgi:beta-1,4-mannooligosaccharide/beta-1,4-mannosyl-N-acetylglucosamine phosphorylase